MKRSTKFAGALAAATMAPIIAVGAAEADTGTVYFSVSGADCAIFQDGSLGCDFARPVQLSYYLGDIYLPLPVTVNEIVIDQPWLPAHPTYNPVLRHTMAGGNPGIATVKTGSGQWGPIIEHAGSSCQVGYLGSFTCQAMGQGFASYGATIVA
ncbi:hypothetical protein ACL02S_16645 [Nocardia sp. 004]|uniref:hypothetical protein n=1 Tax=Nocardia sp. 004 TaxID=3385978 RepID=UPI0039A0270C